MTIGKIKAYGFDNFCPGVVRVWQVEKAKEVFVQSNSQITASAEAGGLSVTNLLINKNVLAMVGVDHTIIFHTLDSFECQKLVREVNFAMRYQILNFVLACRILRRNLGRDIFGPVRHPSCCG
jgi:hypothetical protein